MIARQRMQTDHSNVAEKVVWLPYSCLTRVRNADCGLTCHSLGNRIVPMRYPPRF